MTCATLVPNMKLDHGAGLRWRNDRHHFSPGRELRPAPAQRAGGAMWWRVGELYRRRSFQGVPSGTYRKHPTSVRILSSVMPLYHCQQRCTGQGPFLLQKFSQCLEELINPPAHSERVDPDKYNTAALGLLSRVIVVLLCISWWRYVVKPEKIDGTHN